MKECVGDVPLQFLESKKTHSNIGGFGPDSGDENLRLSNMGVYGDQKFDLLIASTSSRYITKRESAYWHGVWDYFGYLTMALESAADWRFTIVKAGTDEPLALSKFYFTFYDLDSGDPNDFSRGAEIVAVGGFDEYLVGPNTELKITTDDQKRTVFQAGTFGTSADNPSDPKQMTQQQQNRAITFLFTDTSTFDVTYSLTEGGMSTGREVYFGGKSVLATNPCSEAIKALGDEEKVAKEVFGEDHLEGPHKAPHHTDEP